MNDPTAREALLGTAEPCGIKLSQLFEEYEEVTKHEIKDLSPDQLRIWRNGRIRAVERFVALVGDKPLSELTHNDAIDYSEWWRDRLINDGVAAKTANKDIGQLSRMLKEINIRRRLNLPDIFKGLHQRGETDKSRLPYDPAFIQSRFLGGALRELNEDARFVLYVMIETGLRPSEIVNLQEHTIVLDASVPACPHHCRWPAVENGAVRARYSAGRSGAQGVADAPERLLQISRQVERTFRHDQQIPV